ncbi:MAG: ABC transporter permease [Coprobacillus sp.]|nr:ABC transporter permease [Coprobacillus sp.]
MTTYIVGYTIIGLIIAFIIFCVLIKRQVIFAETPKMQKIFAHPLMFYSFRRLASGLISFVLAILVTFFLIRLATPPDNTCQDLFFNPKISTEVYNLKCNNWKDNMGFSGSTIQQLGKFFYAIIPVPKTLCITDIDTTLGMYTIQSCRTFIFDFGRIYKLSGTTDGSFVIDYMMPRMGVSFSIGIIAVVVEMGLGYPFGILMARYQNGIFDRIGRAYIISVDAIPGIAYYYVWMAIFCGWLGLPMRYIEGNFASWLPAILTLGFTGMAGIGLWVRRYMLDQFNSDYVKFARSKGLSERRIMWIHVLRNAIVPLIRTFPTAIISALLGTYYIENIYNIPGIGQAVMISVNSNNSSLLSGIIIVSALLSIISYILGDVCTALADPRISFTKD